MRERRLTQQVNINKAPLILASALVLALVTASPAEAVTTLTDRDLEKYEMSSTNAPGGSRETDGPEALWPGIETWLELSEVESLIERTKDERDRRISELMKRMGAEKSECTGVVGAEYRFDGNAYGILVNATAKKNCELGVERKYDTLTRDTMRAAEERLESLFARKRELEVRQRGLK
jgi:hypothetical protein